MSERTWRSIRSLGYSIISLLASALIAGTASAQETKTKPAAGDEASVWMRKKLEYSQNILAGIATADFDQIASNAESMQTLSKIEGFVRSRTPGYRKQLEFFEDANKEILRQAKRDNVEGSALAFTQLTISCVNCHKQLREEQRK
jgi:cytochrome c556